MQEVIITYFHIYITILHKVTRLVACVHLQNNPTTEPTLAGGDVSLSDSEEDEVLQDLDEWLDQSIAESSLDPSYDSAMELPEVSAEEVLESTSPMMDTTLLAQPLDEDVCHTPLPAHTSTPQSQFRSSQHSTSAEWCGFKVVGDNIDKTIKPRYMRESTGHGSQSLHYFHSYAVKDRVNLSNCSDLPTKAPVEWTTEKYQSVCRKILPTKEDQLYVQDNFVHIMTRVIVNRVPFFQQFHSIALKHIPHAFSQEMAQKSEVVSVTYSACSYILPE